MPKKSRLTLEEKKLIRRYLIWCYKTTKEDLDRIDRYFTQLQVDAHVLKQLLKSPRPKGPQSHLYSEKISAFEEYMDNKEKNVYSKKFADAEGKVLQPEYWYLKNRLEALEKTIVNFLGAKKLQAIRNLYEVEMTRRILEAREHT